MKPQVVKFNEYITRQGLNATIQRGLIADYFFSLKESHISAEDLYLRIKKKHPNIGRVTVYRTLKLLKDAGLASEYQFGENHNHYEPAAVKHHDHFICTDCGSITEFCNPQIEELQEDLAKKHKFEVQSHKMELYGTCSKCKADKKKKKAI